MASNITPQRINPAINFKEIADIHVRKNFKNLSEYFGVQNQLLDFKFFEVSFTTATPSYTLSHGLGVIPQDVIVMNCVGKGSISFNFGLSDSSQINISTTGSIRCRFMLGTYWNSVTKYQFTKSDSLIFNASPIGSTSASSSSTTTTTTPTTTPVIVTGSITPSQLSKPSTASGALSLEAYSTTATTFATAGTFNIAASPAVGRPVFISAMPNGFSFTVTSANATIGAIYSTSNGTLFTVKATIAPSTTLTMTMTTPDPGFPNGATLTKQSGTGDSTITFSTFTPIQSSMALSEAASANSQAAIVEVVRTSDKKLINSASWGSSNTGGVAITYVTSISLLNCVDPASDGTTAYFVRARNILTSAATVSINQALIYGMQL